MSSSMAAEVGENAIDIALKVARALTEVGAEYFVGGSLASSLQGEPRALGGDFRWVKVPLIALQAALQQAAAPTCSDALRNRSFRAKHPGQRPPRHQSSNAVESACPPRFHQT
jgi:hypothetical protein